MGKGGFGCLGSWGLRSAARPATSARATGADEGSRKAEIAIRFGELLCVLG